MKLSYACFALVLAGSSHHHAWAFAPASSSLAKKVSFASTSRVVLGSAVIESETKVIAAEEKALSTPEAGNNTESAKKSFLDDGFVFGLEGSGLERPKGKVASLVVEGDSLETQPYQVAMVAGTFLGHAWFVTTALAQMLEKNGGNMALTAVEGLAVLFSSYVLADLGSGVLHWSVDNYGNGRTPVMGGIIAAFQGHHSAPWTITERGFCNNVYKLCIPFGIPTMALINAISGPMTTLFFTFFCAFEILSQEFHKWSHTMKSDVPDWVNTLQKYSVTIGRKPHALHHTAPYEGYYCIISGICNCFLDKYGIFRRMEHIIYKWNGQEPNAWKLDPELRAKTLRGEYGLPDPSTAKST